MLPVRILPRLGAACCAPTKEWNGTVESEGNGTVESESAAIAEEKSLAGSARAAAGKKLGGADFRAEEAGKSIEIGCGAGAASCATTRDSDERASMSWGI